MRNHFQISFQHFVVLFFYEKLLKIVFHNNNYTNLWVVVDRLLFTTSGKEALKAFKQLIT